MKVWFDTEFIEDGKTIDLISIGLVCEDGTGYYAENAECDLSRASDWVKVNVIPKLLGGKSQIPRAQIAAEIIRVAGEKPEFWAYYADYDWVALCQLCDSLGNPKLPKQDGEHHAMGDAVWTRRAWTFLQGHDIVLKNP